MAPRNIYSKWVPHQHLTSWLSTSWGEAGGGRVNADRRDALISHFSAHPVFAFLNHFLFCFYFLALFSFNKPHSAPTIYSLTCCPPFMIIVQATYDLIYSQKSPANEEGARLLYPKANQGPADQQRFGEPWNSHHYFTSMCL